MYLANLILVSFLSFFYNKNNKLILLFLLLILLTLFAGTRLNIDNDYNQYSINFTESVRYDLKSGYEIVLYFLPKLAHFISKEYYIRLTFLIIAFIGVGTKLIAIKENKYFAVCLLIYTTNQYLGQEMTTIRAGVASGIFLLMINDIVEKKNSSFFVKLVIAMLFHYSSILFLLIWAINKKQIPLKYYLIILLVSFSLLVTDFNVLTLFRIDVLFPKIKYYLEDEGILKLNIFNFRILSAFFYLLLFLVFYKNNKSNKKFVLLFKIHIISLIMFYLFAKNNIVFSLRSFELLSVIQILLLPYLISFFPKNMKILAYVIIIIGCFVNFYYIVYMSGNLKDYETWLI